jgi:hypothetical protein
MAPSPRWLLPFTVLAASVLALFPLHNDDTGFHIATGRWILANGHVPDRNPFSYAQDGATWVQHQWLPAVAMAWLTEHFGVVAVVFAKVALVALAWTLAAWSLVRVRLPAGWASLVLAVGLTASAFRFVERPFLVSILMLGITTGSLLRWSDDRLARAMAVLTPAFALQLHAGGLDAVLVWLAFAVATPRRDVWLGLTAMVALAVGGLALLAPAGLAVLTLPFGFSSNAYWHEHLAEFRSLGFDQEALAQWPLVLGALGLAGLAASRRRWFHALALAGFAALALRHVRMMWPLATVAVPVGGALLAELLPEAWRTRRTQVGLAVAALGWLLVGVAQQHARFGLAVLAPARWGDGVARRRLPLELLDRAARLPERAFVSDGIAGTWLWRVFEAPDKHRLLVHNCLECYKESTYRGVYQRLRYGEGDWQSEVARLGIRTFVLKHTSAGERRFQQGQPNLRQHLYADARYVLVDFDDVASLYAERAGLPVGLATLDGFPLDPDSGQPRPGATAQSIERALLAHAEAHPGGTRALELLAWRLTRSGRTPEAARVLAKVAQRSAVAWVAGPSRP